MRGYDLHLVLHVDPPDETTYFVELYTQPNYKKLWSDIYHWYDMQIFKLPGFKLVEKIHEWFYKHQGAGYIPLVCLQDMRCYDLTNKGRIVVHRFEVTKEQYDAWKGFKTSDT